MTTYYAALFERSMMAEFVGAFVDCSNFAAKRGAMRINVGYQRTDMARNNILRFFEQGAKSEADVCVMMDCDHVHPQTIVTRLAAQCDHKHEIIGALAYRRGQPHDPMFYTENVGGEGWIVGAGKPLTGGLMPCLVVGTGAIAIRKSALNKLRAAGHAWPWFRYEYREEDVLQRSEDFSFGLMATAAGIQSWVDTGCVTPHIGRIYADGSQWDENLRLQAEDNEEFVRRTQGLKMFVKEPASNGVHNSV